MKIVKPTTVKQKGFEATFDARIQGICSILIVEKWRAGIWFAEKHTSMIYIWRIVFELLTVIQAKEL